VNDLDADILAGIPFMALNDIAIRPAKQQITIRNNDIIQYGSRAQAQDSNRVRRTQAMVLRAEPSSSVVWPGSFIELKVPTDIESEETITIEPVSSNVNDNPWPKPQVAEVVCGCVRLVNDTPVPQRVRKHEHIGYVRHTIMIEPQPTQSTTCLEQPKQTSRKGSQSVHSECVTIDPDNILHEQSKLKFRQVLSQYDDVFSPILAGYNGAAGRFEAVINMGPVLPPQRRGRVPQYSKDKLEELQQKFNDLERQGVFRRHEDVGVTAEYLNPSFLKRKPKGGYRLVTADVGRYNKPQPSLMPDVDTTLRTIGQWKYIIKSDLTNAFYQTNSFG